MEDENIQTNSGNEFVPGDLLAGEIDDIDVEDAPEAAIVAENVLVAVANLPVAAENVPLADPHAGSINSGWKEEMPRTNLPTIGDIVPGLRKELTVEQLQDPLGLFKLFVNDAMLENIAKQTNLYHSQLDVERGPGEGARPWLPLLANELCAWLGMVV